MKYRFIRNRKPRNVVKIPLPWRIIISLIFYFLIKLTDSTTLLSSLDPIKNSKTYIHSELPFVDILKTVKLPHYFQQTSVGSGSIRHNFAKTYQAHQSILGREISFFQNGFVLLDGTARDIVALDEGVVIFRGKKPTFGNVVILQHESGVETWYGFLQEVDVYLYQYVTKNQIIGKQSFLQETGKWYSYLAVRKQNVFIHPLEVIPIDERAP